VSSADPYRAGVSVRLRPGREAAVLRGHPWIYRGALAAPVPEPCGAVEVQSADGRTLGVALPGASGGSLALRMVTFGTGAWSRAAFTELVAQAVELRRRAAIDADAYRLVHAEGDGLPGLVVDRYERWAVVQLFEPAWRAYLADLATALADTAGIESVLLRRPGRAGGVETVRGEVPAERVVVRERLARFPVDVVSGQKTGFFLDQRDNRWRCAELAAGGGLLNLFSYSGGFAVAARLCGATAAVNVDASAGALELAREAYRLNSLPVDEASFVVGDAFRVSREMVASGVTYDTVVVDPPAFVKRTADLRRGLEGYRDVNLQALRLVTPGGVVVSCSCSALVSDAQFEGAVLAAALDAGRVVQVLERRSAGADHPVRLACPEPRHLKVLVARVL